MLCGILSPDHVSCEEKSEPYPGCEILEWGSHPSTQPLDFTVGKIMLTDEKTTFSRMLRTETRLQSVKEWVIGAQNEETDSEWRLLWGGTLKGDWEWCHSMKRKVWLSFFVCFYFVFVKRCSQYEKGKCIKERN